MGNEMQIICDVGFTLFKYGYFHLQSITNTYFILSKQILACDHHNIWWPIEDMPHFFIARWNQNMESKYKIKIFIIYRAIKKNVACPLWATVIIGLLNTGS